MEVDDHIRVVLGGQREECHCVSSGVRVFDAADEYVQAEQEC